MTKKTKQKQQLYQTSHGFLTLIFTNLHFFCYNTKSTPRLNDAAI